MYKALLSAQICSNDIKLNTGQMDDEPKHTVKSTPELLKAKTWNVLKFYTSVLYTRIEDAQTSSY